MACNTKHGPAAAIKMYESATGVRLTQADWHIVREEARLDSGGTLSREIIDPVEARTVAVDFYDAAMKSAGREVDPVARDAFADDFASQSVTAGTLHAIDQISQHGLPSAVVARPRRSSQVKPVVEPVVEPVAARIPVSNDTDSLGLNVSEEMTADGLLSFRSDRVLGTMGATQPELRDGQEMLTGLEVGGTDDVSLEDGVRAAVLLKADSERVREAANLMGMDLNQRLYDNGIKTISDGVTGKKLVPRSNFSYKAWRHDEVRPAIAASIAAERGLSVESVSAVMDAYSEFVNTDRYRSAGLRERGLRARDFAEASPGQRDVQADFGSRDGYHSARLSNVLENASGISRLADDVVGSRARIDALPLDEAVREYVAVRQIDRTLGQVAKAVDERASRAIADAGASGVSGFDSFRTGDRVKWDVEGAERTFMPLVAERAGVEGAVASGVVADFKSVAPGSKLKKTALKAAGMDEDEYSSSVPGSFKLKAVKVAAEVA